MPNRDQHRQEVAAFLQNHVSGHRWELTLPPSGRGHETYVAHRGGDRYFVKVGAHVAYYQALASLDVTPAVITTGHLEDGASILVQPLIKGRNPSWQDFRHYLETIAAVVNKIHHSPAIKNVLPKAPSEQYRDVGVAAIIRLRQKWTLHRTQASSVADYVDEALIQLEQDVRNFVGRGLVASHNDICNGNWLIATDGKVYLIDLEAMSLDDPAHDMGSLLWWYYPPELRRRFLEIAGYRYDEAFKHRMRVRMAMHCLSIILPRAQSFDRFDVGSFATQLTDFRAVMDGRENPRGYDDYN